MSKEVKINYNNTFATQHSRDYYRGASFHWSGEWMVGAHYLSDDYTIDYVVHGQVLLACAKSHLSTLDNEPKDFITDESGTVIGVVSTYWDFVLSGIVGKSPGIKIQDNYWYICKDTGVPEEQQVWENTGVKAKMELSDLTPEEIEILQRPGKEVVTEFINNTITQETGQDSEKIMSQKAVTTELDKKATKSELSAAVENEVLRANGAYQPKGDYATNQKVDNLQEEFNDFKKDTDDNFELVGSTLETLQDNIDVVADNIPTKVSELENDSNYQTRSNVDTLLQPIKDVIPLTATAINQLADKNFVNSSIATSTATFRGTSATGLTEQQFLTWANGLTHDDNDYVYWNTTDSSGNTLFKRYKYDGSNWNYEYTLNNSSFTADEWASIQSGITSALVTKLGGIEAGAEVNKIEKIKINGTEQTITNKEVNLPAYPTTLPASDVYTWAKQSTKPSYNLSEIGNADDVKAIENLTGTSGYLKKTGSNTWTLNTTVVTVRELGTVDNELNNLAYGIQWTKNASTCTRVGNPLLHRTLPIQSQMKGCVEKNGEVVYWLNSSDWAYKENGDASALDGTDGYVRVYVPKFYGKSWDTTESGKVMISPVKIDDTWVEIPEHFEDAYESALDRTNLKLCSVMNTTTQYRGGNNSTAYDSSEAMKSLLGKPVTNISRATARTYASNAGSELLNYNIYKWIFLWLPVIEYCNFDLQTAINANLTADGYHQGGLGSGATTFSPWGNYNDYNPIIPCGLTNSLGNGSGQVGINYAAFDSYAAGTVYANRYRGLECPFGDVWTNLDGVIVDSNHSDYDLVYTCDDPSKYGDSITSYYTNTSKSIHTDGYVKEFDLGSTGEITAISVGGGKADYHYTGSVNSTLRTLRAGGNASYGSYAGPGCLSSGGGVSYSDGSIGFRSIKRIY